MNVHTPEQGARFHFEREQATEQQVTYTLVVKDSDHTWSATITYGLTQASTESSQGPARGPSKGPAEQWSPWSESEPPAWVHKTAHDLMRTLRNRATKSQPPSWPRTISRWRAPASY